MNIAFLSTAYGRIGGGGCLSTKLLQEALSDEGHNVTIITASKKKSSLNIKNLKKFRKCPTPLLIPGSSAIDLFLAAEIKKELIRLKPELINVQDPYALPATIAANKKLKIPCIYTCRNNVLPYQLTDLSIREYASYSFFNLRNISVLKSLNQVNHVISISNYIKQELTSAGICNEKITTIYNIPPKIDGTNFLKKHEPNKIKVFCAGRLSPDKGFNVSVEAMRILRDKGYSNITLTIAGSGPRFSHLKKIIAYYRLGSVITLRGWLPSAEVIKAFAYSDIVLLPSIYPEPFGRGSIEAMSFEIPVVASNIGGIPEGVIDNVTGLLVNPGSPYNMAEAILKLSNDKLLRERMGYAARGFLTHRFNKKNITSETMRLYNKVISENDSRRI